MLFMRKDILGGQLDNFHLLSFPPFFLIHTRRILTKESEQFRSEKMKYYVQKKQWNRYFNLSRAFDDVTYSYALTVHKAQGSSIDYVFLDTEDMRYCPDLQKMLYTALTRTKIRAFIPMT
jgi:ATP-dependent exoDNAse (exonuclease V) alpha subunit